MKRIVFISGRGNEGISALMASFLTLQENCVLADCSFTLNRLIRIMHPENVHSTLVPAIPAFSFDADHCSHCYKCLDICMHDAIKLYADIVKYVEHRCTSCGSCIRWCPLSVLDFKEKDDALVYSANSRLGHIVWSEAFIDPFHRPRMAGLIVENAFNIAVKSKSPYLFIRPGRGFGSDAFKAVRHVDTIVMVTAPSPFAVDDLKKMTRFSRLSGHEPAIIVNKCNERSLKYENEILNFCENQGLRIFGRVNWDSLFIKAEQKLQSFIEISDDTESKKQLKETWHKLLETIDQQG